MNLKKLLMVNVLLFLPLTAKSTSLFTPEDLPRGVFYPSFLQEELYFIPDNDGHYNINDLADINNIPVLIITPKIKIKHYNNGSDSLYTKLQGSTPAFIDNKFSFNININNNTKIENDTISIESSGRRFLLDKKNNIINSDVYPYDVQPLEFDSITYIDKNNIEMNFKSKYHYNIISKKKLDNGFYLLKIEKSIVTYNGHYELIFKTPYMNNIKGHYLLHISYDAPSMQNLPQ